MTQQVNLYSPLLRKKKKLFTARAMLRALAVLAVFLGIFAGYARYQVAALQRQAAEFDKQVQAGLERVKKLPPPPAPVDEKMLDARVAELESRLRATEQMFEHAFAAHTQPGYLEPLKALARRRLEGVWLTSITLAGEGGELSLSGRALRAELIPAYIERLVQDPAMRGRKFATLSIERDPAQKPAPGDGGAPEAVVFRLSAPLPSPEGG